MTCGIPPETGQDPIAVVALIVAVLALAWGIAWAIAAHVLAGQRISVSITKMTSLDPTGTIKSQELLQMTVSATGRVAVQVTGWAILFPLGKRKKDGYHFIPSAMMQNQFGDHLAFLASKKLPLTIEPGHSQDIYIPVEPLHALYESQTRDFNEGFIQITFGARRVFRDKKSLAERMRITANPDTDTAPTA
jgi:hypothetical protein